MIKFICCVICAINFMNCSSSELINWNLKLKQFIQIGARFEFACETLRLLETDEHISWSLYNYDGRLNTIDHENLTIDSFEIYHEGIAICQVKNNQMIVIDEKFVFLTNDPTELINHHFEGYHETSVDAKINFTERYCGPDKNIEYAKDDVADFHIDFVQHYERIRQHTNYIQFENVKHEDEGHYECIVRLYNGLVGVRVFFLSVRGGPRSIANRETQMNSEVGDKVTLLCPVFSALPAWYTFVPPNGVTTDMSSLTGHDYLRIDQVSYIHSGTYTCRVTADDIDEGYSIISHIYLNVYGPPEHVEPYGQEYVLVQVNKINEHSISCSIIGNPKPSYHWLLGDVKILYNEKVLSRQQEYRLALDEQNLSLESNYTVTCLAKNNRGMKRQVFIFQLIIDSKTPLNN